MLDNRKRRSANESSDDETLNRPRRRKAGAEEIKLVPAPTEDSILLEENRFMAYTDRYMNNDLYEDEPRQERFFFPDENQNMDEEEEDDFDDDFDEDFEELSDEEFTQLIDGDDEEADADDSCAENSADPEADEWDSLDSEENVFEED